MGYKITVERTSRVGNSVRVELPNSLEEIRKLTNLPNHQYGNITSPDKFYSTKEDTSKGYSTRGRFIAETLSKISSVHALNRIATYLDSISADEVQEYLFLQIYNRYYSVEEAIILHKNLVLRTDITSMADLYNKYSGDSFEQDEDSILCWYWETGFKRFLTNEVGYLGCNATLAFYEIDQSVLDDYNSLEETKIMEYLVDYHTDGNTFRAGVLRDFVEVHTCNLGDEYYSDEFMYTSKINKTLTNLGLAEVQKSYYSDFSYSINLNLHHKISSNTYIFVPQYYDLDLELRYSYEQEIFNNILYNITKGDMVEASKKFKKVEYYLEAKSPKDMSNLLLAKKLKSNNIPQIVIGMLIKQNGYAYYKSNDLEKEGYYYYCKALGYMYKVPVKESKAKK